MWGVERYTDNETDREEGSREREGGGEGDREREIESEGCTDE